MARFDLDFPGGTPKELVAAIQKALRRPLNVIIPDEFAQTKLPALKMASVNVRQLFQALEQASRKSESVPTAVSSRAGFPHVSYTVAQTGYSFNPGHEPISEDTIWTFHVDKPTVPPSLAAEKVCRFYSLAPYLDRQLTVDDITTAIETGWKMLGETSPPAIKFHKDTKLLIAVGEEDKLATIDAALKALQEAQPASARPGPAIGPMIPGEPKRTRE